jgi:rRNA maturation protein Nop10
LAYVVLIFFCGLSAGIIGKLKGSSFWIWFAVGLVLPVIGTIAAICWRWEGREALRQCPECGNIVPLHDQVCMRCGRDLEFPEPSGQAT